MQGIIISIIILFVIVIATMIFMIYIVPREINSYKNIIINPQKGPSKKQCSKQVVQCNKDTDCQQQCSQTDQQNFVCQKVDVPLNKITDFGNTTGICVDKKKVINNCKNGVLTWTAKGENQNMEWDCICPYPTVAGNDNCDINANVCDGISDHYNWNLKDNKNPYTATCKKCPDGFTIFYKFNNEGPICVPKKLKPWYEKTYGSVFTSDDGKIKLLIPDFNITQEYLQSYNQNNFSKNPKVVKFTNDLGESFTLDLNSNVILEFINYLKLDNYIKY